MLLLLWIGIHNCIPTLKLYGSRSGFAFIRASSEIWYCRASIYSVSPTLIVCINPSQTMVSSGGVLGCDGVCSGADGVCSGVVGMEGIDGMLGIGMDGRFGIIGMVGIDGIAGVGVEGIDGIAGVGVDGIIGMVGIDGIVGMEGIDGISGNGVVCSDQGSFDRGSLLLLLTVGIQSLMPTSSI